MTSTLFANRYQKLEHVKTGGTAAVYKAFDNQQHRIVALKIYQSGAMDPAVLNEIWNREHGALEKLNHSVIVKLLDAGRDEETQERYIVLEWIDGETLEEFLTRTGPLSWDQFMDSIGTAIIDALCFAAERDVCHRDLSPGNILMPPGGVPRIIDFGQAKISTVGIGRTVSGWGTDAYCFPETDTGTYTHARDPYAVCAIAIRAITGKQLKNHEVLYAQIPVAPIPADRRPVVEKALSREPADRYKTIIDLKNALTAKLTVDAEQPNIAAIPIRLSPPVDEMLRGDGGGTNPIDEVIAEANELVSVSVASTTGGAARLRLDTRSFRLIVEIESHAQNHLVVIQATRRQFRVDRLLQDEKWNPSVRFTSKLPSNTAGFVSAQKAIDWLYTGLEDHLSNQRAKTREESGAVSEWSKFLEAQRYIARTSIKSIRYTEATQDGARLTVRIENPEAAAEEQLRTISVDGSWVFRGEIESIRGDVCVLTSNWSQFDIDKIPTTGELSIDWNQTRVALDRQAKAVEKFRDNQVPSPSLRSMLLGESTGLAEPLYKAVTKFFDKNLDDAKKAIVSRAAAGVDLLVVHGPPGTGKTKLIVELIQQALSDQPDCKILLVSQTHVALDNALERLMVACDAPCIRIGSGSKSADERVAKCSLGARSLELREKVSKSAADFIESRATALGVDRNQVLLGMAVLDLLGVLDEIVAKNEELAEVQAEFSEIRKALDAEEGKTSEGRARRELRAEALEQELQDITAGVALLRAQQAETTRRLATMGSEGRSLANVDAAELREWSLLILDNEDNRALGRLMRLSEEWRLRFGQSEDFKAAIIASSSVVAGTCVGFCREDAASRATYDLCIVDESGKATTTELLVPLAQSRRAILVGDHHQLPPVLDHELKTPELLERFDLQSHQLEKQLLERLSTDLSDGSKANLVEQYRMRGEIGRLVSDCFYGSTLLEHPSLASRHAYDLRLAGLDSEVTWLDPYACSIAQVKETVVGRSFRNSREASCIVSLLKRIAFVLRQKAPKSQWPTIGVISGYAPQVQLLRTEIRRHRELDDLVVDCSSVHAFQGREVDICIYSVTRKNDAGRIGMLKDWRHLNVAISRALSHLVIVGSFEFCRAVQSPNPFSKIIEFIEDSTICTKKEWSDD